MAIDMTKGSEAKAITAFALPIMGGFLLQQLYNTVDSVVVGRTLGQAALSAVGTCSPLTMLAVSFATGLCNGESIVLSQFYGAKKYGDLRNALSTSLILLTALSVAVTVLGLCFARGLLGGLLSVPDEIIDGSMQYFTVYCVGLVFQFIYNVIAAALRSVGDSRATLLFLMISSVLNIILDLLFVLVFRWGIAGTAIATVISQAVSAAVSVHYILKKYAFFRFGRGDFVFDGEKCRMVLKLGVPTMVQMCIVSGGNVLVQKVTNSLGTVAIAAATAAGRIENYMFIPCQGFNNGVGTFTGQNMGAGNIDRVISGMKKTLKIVVPLAFVLAAALFLFAGPLVSVFGVMDDALELGEMHLHFIAPFFVLFTAYMVFAGVLTGSGDVLASTSITLSGLALRVICANVFCYVFRWGFRSLYYAIPVGWVLCFILALVRYFGGKWKSKALVKHGRPDEA